jgi:signal transduction histidine kinase
VTEIGRPTSEAGPFCLPSGLIHDLRTPLNQIIGYSEMLTEHAEDAGRPEFVPDLQMVRSAGLQLLALITLNFKPILLSRAVASAPTKVPTVEASNEDRTQVAASTEAAQGLVLVVDDDEANRDLLTRRLESQGYSVVSAENGQLALDMTRSHAFDLVLLDIMMPIMDGYEVLGLLKADERLRDIPVIMISALGDMDSVVRCIEMGADDYLPKPFDPILLKARTRACLERKRGRDREQSLYAHLQQNYRRLEELEKLRDDLTHMIIHDLRTPLASMIAGMQTLEVVGEMNGGQREVIGIALAGGQTLLGMINDLLDVEKLEAGGMQLDYGMVSAADLVASAIDQVSLLAQNGRLMFVRQVEAGLPLLLADESKLRRTLVNLLGNAMKFTPPGGTVTLEARLDEGGQSIAFSVMDTGEGIPPEAFERIFEKFGQVESRQRGRTMSTGLGLTFCKLAVESHGGHIWVESVAGQGSTFRFTIPLAPASDREK